MSHDNDLDLDTIGVHLHPWKQTEPAEDVAHLRALTISLITKGLPRCQECDRPAMREIDYRYWGSNGWSSDERRVCQNQACEDKARAWIAKVADGEVEDVRVAPFAADVVNLIATMTGEEAEQLDSLEFWSWR